MNILSMNILSMNILSMNEHFICEVKVQTNFARNSTISESIKNYKCHFRKAMQVSARDILLKIALLNIDITKLFHSRKIYIYILIGRDKIESPNRLPQT